MNEEKKQHKMFNSVIGLYGGPTVVLTNWRKREVWKIFQSSIEEFSYRLPLLVSPVDFPIRDWKI